MKRREFLQYASAIAGSRVLPVGFGMSALAERAYAASPNYGNVSVTAPTVMPQVINVFMYGGASELAGNLSNIADINTNSVNDYSAGSAFGSSFLDTMVEDAANGQITANEFWRDAGGIHMEDMLAAGDMSVYRTIYKQKSPTRSHRESIFMSHKGTLDIENSPGIGSRLALMMLSNQNAYAGARLADGSSIISLDTMTLPFVSFEGDSQTFAQDPDNKIPLYLRGLTMDNSFNNPYTRSLGYPSDGSIDTIDSLLSRRLSQLDRNKYSKAFDGFDKREEMEGRMENLSDLLNGSDANGNQSSAQQLGITYPNTSFAREIEAAVTLAIHNPETLYIAVGTPGLGGWDDHNNGIDRYADRMNDLMEAIKAGMAHINASNGVDTIRGGTRNRTDNIVINVFGDFGRLVNLNNSGGWDHANNQNLYTFGGAGVRPPAEASALGSVIGTTHREGRTKTNNQYTVPDSDSPTWEPMSIAASIYGYFGASNPEILTADPTYNPSGDQTLASKLSS
ncbi:DUF1501 domain-containing protein [Bermanella marisrubri]|uniref:Elongation factor EF-2 n=1 Tax=Bermanella marisrubri TaxID=207949 RepID=Q1N0V4_9GAMM|nr:DUF1501 domain-containing protein [Bermanella marisrubri]EAT11920.1 elongation factor EF-2 [Oceanobacter sp. RED65] [Bermanella marisrubri]QIZ83004.1 DUF1501 domain-containing protein [Bermanella marisrubri]